MNFEYRGEIPASKSIMNRAQILASFNDGLAIKGQSSCDDVVNLKKAIQDFRDGLHLFEVGEGGTTFRFFLTRISRVPGVWKVLASDRLLDRPQQGLFQALKFLGVSVSRIHGGILVSSNSWRDPETIIEIADPESSQFFSAIVLSSWNLPFDLRIRIPNDLKSRSYFDLTLQMATSLGLQYSWQDDVLYLPAEQKINKGQIPVEADVSSAFSVAALAALDGECLLRNFPKNSAQPDLQFVEILQNAGVEIVQSDFGLHVKKSNLNGIQANLKNCPDLFPVLAVVCGFAQGQSHLFGAPQLKDKESNRLQKTSELLRLAGISHTVLDDGMKIQGGMTSDKLAQISQVEFDPDQDHRMAMASLILRKLGLDILVKNIQCLNKSFPEFLEISK